MVSPYAKKNYVSHTIYDHTSILKTVEEKWNLPALTRATQTQTVCSICWTSHQAGIPETANTSRRRQSDGEGRVPDHWRRHHSSSVGGHQDLIEGYRGRGQARGLPLRAGRDSQVQMASESKLKGWPVVTVAGAAPAERSGSAPSAVAAGVAVVAITVLHPPVRRHRPPRRQ